MPYYVKDENGDLKAIDKKLFLTRTVVGEKKAFAELELVKGDPTKLKITLDKKMPAIVSWGRGFREMSDCSSVITASDVIIEQGEGKKRKRYIIVYDSRDMLPEEELEIEYQEPSAQEDQEPPVQQEEDTSLNFGTLPRRRH
jgi:hypothetical protein